MFNKQELLIIVCALIDRKELLEGIIKKSKSNTKIFEKEILEEIQPVINKINQILSR